MRKLEVTAKLMAGQWIDNPYYTKKDYEALRLVSFSGQLTVPERAYSESIYSPDKLEVKRTTTTYTGKPYTTIVKLSPKCFWALIRYVENYYARHQNISVNSIAVSAIAPDCE